MKSRLFNLFIVICCIAGASSCKVKTISYSKNNTSNLSDSVVNLAYSEKQTKLHPNEAIIIFNVVSISKKSNYTVILKQLKSQGFGFSSNLKPGDSIEIKSTEVKLAIGTQYMCIVEQSDEISSATPTFTLIRALNQ